MIHCLSRSGMFLARRNSARLCIAWVNGRLARMQRCDRVMGVRVSNSGSLCDPSLVSVIRKPKIPLLPLWEKGVGGMRGKNARECRKPLISPRNSTLESPRGRDARAPRSTAPCGRDARAPRSTAPCGQDARAPRSTAPCGQDARAPRSTAPCGQDARAPRSTAPCGRDARAPRSAAPRGRDARAPRSTALPASATPALPGAQRG